MTEPKNQDGTTKVTFRIPNELYERIKQAAKYSGRPLNSEVITWLQFKDLAESIGELKQQNDELLRIAKDTAEAVGARK